MHWCRVARRDIHRHEPTVWLRVLLAGNHWKSYNNYFVKISKRISKQISTQGFPKFRLVNGLVNKFNDSGSSNNAMSSIYIKIQRKSILPAIWPPDFWHTWMVTFVDAKRGLHLGVWLTDGSCRFVIRDGIVSFVGHAVLHAQGKEWHSWYAAKIC